MAPVAKPPELDPLDYMMPPGNQSSVLANKFTNFAEQRGWTEALVPPRHLAMERSLLMDDGAIGRFVRDRFAQVHGAAIEPDYPSWYDCTIGEQGHRAALGCREAGSQALFLEIYLDGPIEHLVSQAFGRFIPRIDIVEIGCLASESPAALLTLWQTTAHALAERPCVAVATLTATVRRLLGRIGVTVTELAIAKPHLVASPAMWGRYYDDDPRVCAGIVSDGADQIARYVALRTSAS